MIHKYNPLLVKGPSKGYLRTIGDGIVHQINAMMVIVAELFHFVGPA